MQRCKFLRNCLKLALLLFLALTLIAHTKLRRPISNTLIGLDTEDYTRAILSTNLSTTGDSSEIIGAYVTTPSEVCDHPRTFLVYMLARPTEFEWRDVIRRTWANTLHYNSSCVRHGFNIQVIFAMGLSPNMSRSDRDRLSQEVTQHQDIWIGQFEDTYDNLVLKGIGVLSWIKDTCPGDRIDFVMKIDEDVFPNLYSLLTIAWSIRSGEKENTWPHFICQKPKGLLVHRDPKGRLGKYSVSFEEYPGAHYPPHCLGWLYIMSREGMSLVVQGTTITKPFRMEDVYMTGIAPLAVQPDLRFVEIRRGTKRGRLRGHFMLSLAVNMYERVLLQLAGRHCGHR